MPRTPRRHPGAVAVALTVALLASACGEDAPPVAVPLSGELRISGSSTVEPISSLVAEKFAEQNPDVRVSVDGPGTGDGFQAFCAGDTDISDASRPITEAEAAACEQAGVEFVELQVGIDGLSVITSASNDAVTCLDFGSLYALLGPESEGVTTWNEANRLAVEVGGAGGLPDAPLTITGPGKESGTYDALIGIVFEDILKRRGIPEQAWALRPDYTASASDNAIIEGVSGHDASLGWVGYAFAVEHRDTVKLLEIDGGAGCVAPTPATIAGGSYPISRPLFIYVNAARAQEHRALAAFVDYYLSDEGMESVTEAGYVAMSDERTEATRDAWETRTTGV